MNETKFQSYRDELAIAYFQRPDIAAILSQNNISPQTEKLLDAVLKIQKEVTGVGGDNVAIPLLTENNESRIIGVRDFIDAKLPKGIVAFVKGIRASWGTDAAITDPKEITFSSLYDDGTTGLDPALAHCIVEIRQQNDLKFEMPFRDLLCEQVHSGPMGEQFYWLDNNFMLLPEFPIQIDLRFGDTIDNAAKWHVEIALKVSKTVKK
jgi:hypothetical protein